MYHNHLATKDGDYQCLVKKLAGNTAVG